MLFYLYVSYILVEQRKWLPTRIFIRSLQLSQILKNALQLYVGYSSLFRLRHTRVEHLFSHGEHTSSLFFFFQLVKSLLQVLSVGHWSMEHIVRGTSGCTQCCVASSEQTTSTCCTRRDSSAPGMLAARMRLPRVTSSRSFVMWRGRVHV